MSEITNSDRAAWAEAALDTFMAVCPTDREDAIKDLITDLLHLARREDGADVAVLALRAVQMHDIELADDEEEDDDWSCDNCGETAQDGTGECISCGQEEGEA